MAAKGTLPANTRVSDEEFIRVWKKHGGHVATVARELGYVNERQCYSRRRKVEERIGASLISGAPQSQDVTISQHNAFFKTNIQDGTVLVASDCHYWPGEFTTAQRAFLYFVQNFEPRPKAVIVNGDVFDGSRLSRFPRLGFLEKRPTVKDEIEVCKLRLGEIEDAAPKSALLVWPLGNHDLRYEASLAAGSPESEGVFGLALKDHFSPRWNPCWTMWVNEKGPGWTEIKHRFRGGIHATWNNTLHAGISILTGHLHNLNIRPFSDRRGTRYGVDTGTLADVDGDNIGSQFVHYLEANPVNWRSGFVVLTFKDGRLLCPEPVLKWDEEHVEFRGQLIRV